MPVEILVKASDHGVWGKGSPVIFKDDDDLLVSPWGSKEGLPDFVIVRISDATKEQVATYLDEWRNVFDYEILVNNPQGYRVKVSVHPLVAQVAIDKAVKQKVRDLIVDDYGGSVHQHDSVNNEWAVFDIPKPVDLQALKNDFLDQFEEIVGVRRYYFPAADVDVAVSAGGKITVTKAVADNKIIDRLN